MGLYKRGRVIKVPCHAHPLVKRVFAKIIADGLSAQKICETAGVTKTTLQNWHKNQPGLNNFVAVANSVGFDVVLQERRA